MRVIQARDHPREALQRIGAQRKIGQRLAARPRQPKLRPHDLDTATAPPRRAGGLAGSGPALCTRSKHTERRADRGQRPLGHAERVAHPTLLVGVEQHAHRARSRIKPAADETTDTRELSGAPQHRIKARVERVGGEDHEPRPGGKRAATSHHASRDHHRHQQRQRDQQQRAPQERNRPLARSPKKTVPRRATTRREPNHDTNQRPNVLRGPAIHRTPPPLLQSATARADAPALAKPGCPPPSARARHPPTRADRILHRPSPPRGLGTVTGNSATGDRDCDDGGQLSERDGSTRRSRQKRRRLATTRHATNTTNSKVTGISTSGRMSRAPAPPASPSQDREAPNSDTTARQPTTATSGLAS